MTTRVPSITYNWEEYLLGNEYTAGTGISISQNNEISNSWVTSVNGNTWAVTVTEPTVVSGDSGVTYTIKVSNSDPTSWTASNIITLVP